MTHASHSKSKYTNQSQHVAHISAMQYSRHESTSCHHIRNRTQSDGYKKPQLGIGMHAAPCPDHNSPVCKPGNPLSWLSPPQASIQAAGHPRTRRRGNIQTGPHACRQVVQPQKKSECCVTPTTTNPSPVSAAVCFLTGAQKKSSQTPLPFPYPPPRLRPRKPGAHWTLG